MSLVSEYRFVFETRLGWMSVHADQKFLRQLTFGHASRDVAAADGGESLPNRLPTAWLSSLIDRLRLYTQGECVDFHDVPLDLTARTLFQQSVIAVCRNVSWGQTVTYGELAARAGFPKAARAVGQCMASNGVPIVVPCHRVVAHHGQLRGFSAAGGIDTKRRMLEMERSGKVEKLVVSPAEYAML